MNKSASAAGVGPGFTSPSAGPTKIIQRILRPRQSYWVTEGRMCNANEALVEQSQKGDLAAFETLIREHQRMIHSLTFRMTGSIDDLKFARVEPAIKLAAPGFSGDFPRKAYADRPPTTRFPKAISTYLNLRKHSPNPTTTM
jgi:hypothetical protein